MLREERIEHLLRRAGFGVSQGELEAYVQMGSFGTLKYLLDYEEVADDVDSYIGKPGYVGVTLRGGELLSNTNINDARQRWLFRMVHTERPLQEKMALFWHNHFATAYSKLAGTFGGDIGTAMIAANPKTDATQTKGQIELFREFALGNFRDLLIAVSKDAAMLVWLDGRLNTRDRPQENFGREILELFTMGVGHYTEEDIYAAARVFTGWNLRRVAVGTTARYDYVFNAGQHDANAKTFSFAIYPDGNRTIPARSAANGEQDGIDFINAIVAHPETGRRLARKLWTFFISEIQPPTDEFQARIAAVFSSNRFEMKPVVRAVLTSPEFHDPASAFSRYSWPAEFVVRSLKEVGSVGYSVQNALTPMANMGQTLFEPPDVNGWELGAGWFSTASMLARMNFAASLTTNQRVELRNVSREFGRSADSLLLFMSDKLTVKSFEADARDALRGYLLAGRNWTGNDADLLVKAPGLAHLVMASANYQII